MPLASQRGKKKADALQPAKGMTDEKGQRLLPLASQRGKKKTNALQLAKGMTEEKKKEERPRCGCTGVP